MPASILTCPHCGASLAASRFAANVICRYCNATVRIDPSFVSASAYRKAWQEWNDTPAAAHEFAIDGTRWTALRLVGRGEVSDVYLARRARWPSELVAFKVLRNPDDKPLLEQEHRVLTELQRSDAAAGMDLGLRIPDPVAIGPAGAAYRWASGFTHTFEMIRDVHPEGIEPVAAIWVWRRILEVLAVMKRAGVVHGAILPNHLLVQRGEHGVRLVGFSCAGAPGASLNVVVTQFEDIYAPSLLNSQKLSHDADVVMSARCVSYLLGRRAVPAQLADLLRRAGTDGCGDEPWDLRREVGAVGEALFGPPSFHPIDI